MSYIDVLGIDPGSRFTGWGIVRDSSGVLSLIDCGIINTIVSERHNTQKEQNMSFSHRLAIIFNDLTVVISKYRPECAAIEQVFTACNAAAALKLGQARGTAVAACAAFGLSVYDYEPTLIKKSLTGAGRADKEQVAFMVKRILNIRQSTWKLDTTDALAAAICHLSQQRFIRLAQGKKR